MGEKRKNPSTRGAKEGAGNRSGSEGTDPGARRRRRAKPPAVGIAGVPGSKNPERRCTATSAASGERCKRAAIKGGFVCTSHGGASPQARKKAKERLLELVDPALAALQKVLTSDADDSVKVRAALGILDRTGFKPGVQITVGVSKWDELLDDVIDLDRSLPKAAEPPAVGLGGGDPAWEDKHQLAYSAQEDADREREDEEVHRIRPDERTILGQVVDTHALPDRDPNAPPRYADE
jgi:hypothetical protein